MNRATKDWYNGFSPKERSESSAWRRARSWDAPRSCYACGTTKKVGRHRENYCQPFKDVDDTIHLCKTCHVAVHRRDRDRSAWDAYRDRVRPLNRRPGQPPMLDEIDRGTLCPPGRVAGNARAVGTRNWSAPLREEIIRAAQSYAAPIADQYLSKGGVILFRSNAAGDSHGNFLNASYRQLLQKNEWAGRLEKIHTRADALGESATFTPRELDSCMSSDALLMNIFCYPGVVTGPIAKLFAVKKGALPEFGVKALVPLVPPRPEPFDRTELDMVIGDTIVEAKLTEKDFTTAPVQRLQTYRDFDEVFDLAALGRTDSGLVRGYQLIRNVLALKHRAGRQFVTIFDARRPDLMAEWEQVKGAIVDKKLKTRCRAITWQLLSRHIPTELQEFLLAKYAIRYS